MQAADAEGQRLEARQSELENYRQAAGEELRNCESEIGVLRQHITHEQATIDHERSRAAELEEEAGLHGAICWP